MKKVLFTLVAFTISNIYLHAQDSMALEPDSLKHYELDEIVVASTRVGQKDAVAHSNLNEEQIKKENAAKNIPFVLQTLPSVVAYSEDGTGVGNTQYKIRGTDANRINVTLNGMPVNNPESQDVFWVNLPDLSNSLKSIQVQRGVGTSTNGASSFGGSISLQTVGSRAEAYGEASTAIGSYNTFLATIAAGTGVLKNGLSIDGRYSRTTADGYIRNGKVNHRNGNITLAHYTDKQVVKLMYINGIQHTGITWEGIDPEKMKEDRRYNKAGEYKDEMGNVKYYDNETDNYYSNILQAIYSRNLTNNLTLNVNFSYNSGYGYYENYKTDQKLSKFGLKPQTISRVEYKKTDIIRRKSMSNDLYVGMANAEYKTNRLRIAGGGMFSYYDGNHYGRLLWAKHDENIGANYEWYRNYATKRDMNLFAKGEYDLVSNDDHLLSLSGEMQYRYVDYRLEGPDDDLVDITQNNYYSFANPKVGIAYNFKKHHKLFASFGIANREPLRADLQDYHKSGEKIKSERLYDYECGYTFANDKFTADVNLYYMDYKDQLVLTGKLSDVGYKLQENADKSYRMGIELVGAYTPFRWLRLDANATFSRNKIKDYTVYYATYKDDVNWEESNKQVSEYIGTTDISYSPNIIGSGVVTIMPMKNLSFSLINKFVGKMYYDNTSNKENQLGSYYVANLSAAYTFETKKFGAIDLQFFVNNIFNRKYVANAWVDTSKFENGAPDAVYKGLFPQAPCNIMARVGIRF